MAKKITLTQADHSRLSQLLDVNFAFGDENAGACLRELNSDLVNAKIVEPDAISGETVTMNSRVVIRDSADAEEDEYVLVFPPDADIFENRISVLAPMGVALLGSSVGDTVRWSGPKGELRAEILDIKYQPEAAGDFHL